MEGKNTPDFREPQLIEETISSLRTIADKMKKHEEGYMANDLIAPEKTVRLLEEGKISEAALFLEDYAGPQGLNYLEKDIQDRINLIEELKKIYKTINEERLKNRPLK